VGRERVVAVHRQMETTLLEEEAALVVVEAEGAPPEEEQMEATAEEREEAAAILPTCLLGGLLIPTLTRTLTHIHILHLLVTTLPLHLLPRFPISTQLNLRPHLSQRQSRITTS
jgi:hypothetical protein